jgi:hypothetical protein
VNRIGPGDALIGLALLTLVLASLLPSYRARAFDATVEDAVADIDRLRTAALQAYRLNGGWPPAMEPGRVPPGMSGVYGGDGTMVREAYVLEWRLWHRVARVPAPPRATAPASLDDDEVVPTTPRPGDAPPDSVGPELMPVVRPEGAIVVHSSQELLLAELLRLYGDTSSFVRDTTWTLLITAGSGETATP